METAVDRELDVVREFLRGTPRFRTAITRGSADTGPHDDLSVKSKRATAPSSGGPTSLAAQPGSALYNDIVRWADRIRDYGVPIYFTFNHEPESKRQLGNGEAPDFIAAWRKIHDIFAERGATNVKFMWIMTDYSFFVGSQAPQRRQQVVPG